MSGLSIPFARQGVSRRRRASRDAFGAVLCRVPTLDMLRYPSLSLGGSALEYGTPTDPVEGAYLAGYSPYHNVRPDRAYPPMLFVSALEDRIARPQDPLKMVARLQAPDEPSPKPAERTR
jgi:prolyl oligopeptidase